MKTIIAVPDFTREAHLKKILPGLLKKLKKQHIPNKDTEIIIATGLHRPPTKKEIRANLGSIPDRIKVSVHDYRKNSVAYFGRTKKGIPIYLNKKIKNTHSIITVGVVEPHLYAGYSGGTKVVAIGLAGEKTINATHHPRFLDHTRTRICSIKQNPFRNFIHEVTNLLPIKYSINIINDKNGKLLRVFQGNAQSSFEKAIGYSQKIFEKKTKGNFDVVICDIPDRKAINMYQASRAFNYVTDTRKSILNPKSLILVKAALKEGFGKGLGEKRFMNKMLKMKDPKRLLKNIKKKGSLAGEHRAYMVAKAMLKARLGFISKRAHLYKNKPLPFLFFNNLEEAHKFIKKLPRGYDSNVGERGITLSLGQRQRVCLARTILKDPKILILDEATSSLDSESENLVQVAMDNLMVGRTSIIIAHRLSTIMNVDFVIVLQDGEIVERGTHAELWANARLYRHLLEQQFGPMHNLIEKAKKHD